MGGASRGDTSIQAFFSPTPNSSPVKSSTPAQSSDPLVGDGFTAEEIQEALRPRPAEPWHPQTEYAELDIRDLQPGPKAVTFMGRVANIFDVANTPKTPRSAKGCVKLCVKDDRAAITVRLWYAKRLPAIRLGSLVSVWTTHISNGENGALSSLSAPLFASLFPERDRSCHLMVHENSDNGAMYRLPLGYREGRPLGGVMTLSNFNEGGYDVVDAKILVVVKSIGAKKKGEVYLGKQSYVHKSNVSVVTRKDTSTVENLNVHIQDNTAETTLGLWGTSVLSPLNVGSSTDSTSNPDAAMSKEGWKAGETILLIQAPGWKIGRNTYLSLTTATLIDIDPAIPDADWLRRWSLRQRSREAINPPFPSSIFDYHAIKSGPVRCLFTLSDLDEFARAAPAETFQGYLSVLIMEVKLFDCFKRGMLLSGECCNFAAYANAVSTTCKGCGEEMALRLNPRVLGQVVDETAAIGAGKLLFSDRAWKDLLGRDAGDLLKLGQEGIRYLADRLLFCRVSLMFGWTGDETKAGGRVCVLGVSS